MNRPYSALYSTIDSTQLRKSFGSTSKTRVFIFADSWQLPSTRPVGVALDEASRSGLRFSARRPHCREEKDSRKAVFACSQSHAHALSAHCQCHGRPRLSITVTGLKSTKNEPAAQHRPGPVPPRHALRPYALHGYAVAATTVHATAGSELRAASALPAPSLTWVDVLACPRQCSSRLLCESVQV